jgi:hypothetical protein
MELWAVVLGWGLAVVSGIAAYFAQGQLERRRERRQREAREAAQALELMPGIGHGWWLTRKHAPAVTIQHLSVWDAAGNPRDVSENFIEGLTMEIGAGYGLGIDLYVGDYIELHWTDTGVACQDGTRIFDPEKIYSFRNDGPGH